jgi:hypothetical protein
MNNNIIKRCYFCNIDLKTMWTYLHKVAPLYDIHMCFDCCDRECGGHFKSDDLVPIILGEYSCYVCEQNIYNKLGKTRYYKLTSSSIAIIGTLCYECGIASFGLI